MIIKGVFFLKIAIVTTTYNRRKLLNRLYLSLERQTDSNFTWIIIDDGSTDNTATYINNLNSSFEIRYFYKENSGKARSLNYAFSQNTDIDLYTIVDSDDYLLDRAVETVKKAALEYNNNKIGGLFFRYLLTNEQILGENKNVYTEPTVMSRIEHDATFDKIDGCICYFKRAVQRYRYPEFKNEKYMGPTVLQMKMSTNYKIAFLTEIIGVAEYQRGGLTSSGRKIRIESPKSMLIYCHYMQDLKFDYLTRIKYGIMANAYYYFIKNNYHKNERINVKLNIRIPKKFRILGYLLYVYWKTRFLN